MSKIKYKQPVNQHLSSQQFDCYLPQNDRKAVETALRPFRNQEKNMIMRDSEVIIMSQVEDSGQKPDNYSQSYRINRVRSYQSKSVSITKQKYAKALRDQKTTKSSADPNKQNNFEVLHLKNEKKSYSTHKIPKITKEKSNIAMKILDFRTNIFKVTTKKIVSPTKMFTCRKEDSNQLQSMEAKIKNLYDMAVMNAQEDINDLKDFQRLNSFIHRANQSSNLPYPYRIQRSRDGVDYIEEVPKYSNNDLYRQVRKVYKKEESQTTKMSKQNERSSPIKGVFFRDASFLIKNGERISKKYISNLPHKKAKETRRYKQEERLQGW